MDDLIGKEWNLEDWNVKTQTNIIEMKKWWNLEG